MNFKPAVTPNTELEVSLMVRKDAHKRDVVCHPRFGVTVVVLLSLVVIVA